MDHKEILKGVVNIINATEKSDIDFVTSFEKEALVRAYMKNDSATFNEYINKYPEFKHIEMFIKIAEAAFNHFKKNKMCTFNIPENDFFSLIDCTFKGYSDMLYITSEDFDMYNYPLLNYDHSCMLYIEIPEDFDNDPEKYKDEFIRDATLSIVENYIIVLKEDEEGLTGKTLPNPDYKDTSITP